MELQNSILQGKLRKEEEERKIQSLVKLLIEQNLRLKEIQDENERQKVLEQQRKHQEQLEKLKIAKKEAEARNEEIQKKFNSMKLCPAGYTWNRVRGGWRCSGGSHYVNDAMLQKYFTE